MTSNTHKSVEEIVEDDSNRLYIRTTKNPDGELITGKEVTAFFTQFAQQQVQEAVAETYQRERAYWVNVFDSAPVRETEHPHDIVARNFARIELNRIDDILSTLKSKQSVDCPHCGVHDYCSAHNPDNN